MALTRILGHLVAVAMFGCLVSAQEGRMMVDFPPGHPTSENIRNICLHSKIRPRYPITEIPNHGYLMREVDAIHRTEAWYSQQCCQGDWEQNMKQTVCCARHAWKKALAVLCEEEARIKTRQRSCCLLRGEKRWHCFTRKAPNPSYQTSDPYSGPDVLPQGPAFTYPSSCSTKQ